MAGKRKRPESVVIPADLILKDWKKCGYANIGRLVVYMADYISSGMEGDDYKFNDSILTGKDPIRKPVPADSYQYTAERIVEKNVETYLEKCEKNSENGKKGGAPAHKKRSVEKVANGTPKKRTVQKSTEVYRKYPNVNGNVNGNLNVNNISLDNGSISKLGKADIRDEDPELLLKRLTKKMNQNAMFDSDKEARESV